MDFLKNYPLHHQVYFLTPEQPGFESAYLAVRAAEGRIYTDELVRQLPRLPAQHSQYQEWRRRKRSTLRLLRYLKNKRVANILDLGCGNGWLTHQLAVTAATSVLGLDINRVELEQAASLFSSERCHFGYGDIFTAELPKQTFDAIILNSCIQYFENLKMLLDCLLELVAEQGSIHILDSPIYEENELVAARKRTQHYYQKLGFPKMADQYYHHSWDTLKAYDYSTPYNPQKLLTKVRQRLFLPDSPFPWVILKPAP